MHQKRAVTLAKISLRPGKVEISRHLNNLGTLVINLLERMNVKNMIAQLETFADKFPTLILFLTQPIGL